jgi:hypothetical protein
VEIDVQLGQMTLRSKHLAALESEIAHHPDVTMVFGDSTIQASSGVQFASPLCDGTWKIGSQSTPVDTSHRLRYVAVALNSHAQGTFLYIFVDIPIFHLLEYPDKIRCDQRRGAITAGSHLVTMG